MQACIHLPSNTQKHTLWGPMRITILQTMSFHCRILIEQENSPWKGKIPALTHKVYIHNRAKTHLVSTHLKHAIQERLDFEKVCVRMWSNHWKDKQTVWYQCLFVILHPSVSHRLKNIKHSVTWRRAMINDSDWTFIDPEARGGELFLPADAPFPSLKSSETKSARSVPTPAHYSTHGPEQKPKWVKTQDRLSDTSLIYQSALALKVKCVISSMFKSCCLLKSLPLLCGTQK